MLAVGRCDAERVLAANRSSIATQFAAEHSCASAVERAWLASVGHCRIGARLVDAAEIVDASRLIVRKVSADLGQQARTAFDCKRRLARQSVVEINTFSEDKYKKKINQSIRKIRCIFKNQNSLPMHTMQPNFTSIDLTRAKVVWVSWSSNWHTSGAESTRSVHRRLLTHFSVAIRVFINAIRIVARVENAVTASESQLARDLRFHANIVFANKSRIVTTKRCIILNQIQKNRFIRF